MSPTDYQMTQADWEWCRDTGYLPTAEGERPTDDEPEPSGGFYW